MTVSLLLLIFGIVSLQPAHSSSVQEPVAGEFLKLGVGARAVAMGEAYSAVADEATALYWNPAALTRIEKRSATLMHAQHVNSFFDYAAYADNMGRWGAWGTGFEYLATDQVLTMTNETGEEGRTFRPSDLMASLGFAYKFGQSRKGSIVRGLSVGIAAKFIRSTIVDSAQTGAADIGILSPSYLGDRLRFAATVSNIGGEMTFSGGEPSSLPLVARVGSSINFSKHWLCGLDVSFPRDNTPYVAAGMEYAMPVSAVLIAGRVGINSRPRVGEDRYADFSLGVGFAFPKLAVDYGFLPLQSLGSSHRISLTIKFGAPSRARPAPVFMGG